MMKEKMELQGISHNWFERIGEKIVSNKFKHDLESVHMGARGTVYLSITIPISILSCLLVELYKNFHRSMNVWTRNTL